MVTRREVAQKAGVSPSTVSRVINNNGYVAIEARERVEAAIAELNYIPNRAAQNLRMKSYKQIACITPSITNSFFTEMFVGIEEMALERGYSLSLYNITKEKKNYLKQVLEGPYDGMILLASYEISAIMDFDKNELHMPLSLYLDRVLETDIPHVFIDLNKVMKQSVEHLIQRGHKEIIFLGHYFDNDIENARYEGYESAMKAHHLPIKDYYKKYIEMYDDKLTTGYAAIKSLLENGQSFTAVAASNDLLAAGAMRAIIESGKKVPDDISVIGVDNIELANIVTPTLTTMNIPKREIGRILVEQLLDQLLNEKKVKSIIEADVTLIERESVKNIK
ncbi:MULTISPECIES: LacI family DNA-binding transcriptional regulator [Bacillaceae]|uniref:DNA-binding LacI/PurR family transcriptional regulator n=1 Tax=Peribacillus huizhouensis TaxID=1501239 RepID=A0ABR6CUK3_9BACI|nr:MULTISPECIES: LacI family DNA-binding transcriptional regulator [Bacillaceae]MBA9028709.1 DNA-binding LacI/PurR family transcriptional regulator [Peribacillus huizhouensis]